MKVRGFDARRLDVEAFAAESASLEGEWPLDNLPRLAASSHDPSAPGPAIRWRVAGRLVKARVGPPEVWLDLEASTHLPLQCQRCLGSVGADVTVDRALRFVPGEAAAAALDADSEDDVLELTRALDLRDLVEDELILALPLVPMHDRCPQPLVAATEAPAPAEAERPHPFAALAALKAAKPGGSA